MLGKYGKPTLLETICGVLAITGLCILSIMTILAFVVFIAGIT